MTNLSRRTVLKGTAASFVAAGTAGALTSTAGPAQAAPFSVVYGIAPGPAGDVEYGLLGTIPSAPAPTLVILSLTIDRALTSSHLQAGTILVEPPANYLCVSIDPPCHGGHLYPGRSEGLPGWAELAVDEHDFVADFNTRLKQVLDHLIDEELVDAERIAVAGTSRGGFLALRYAAFDPRVACAVGYAPVTDLRQVSEFATAASVPFVDELSLAAHLDPLVGRPVYIVIGDRDVRVGTDSAIEAARALSAAAVTGFPVAGIVNPSFEDLTGGWPAPWTLDPLPKTQTAGPSTTQAHTGTGSLRVENASGTAVGVRTPRLPAVPGSQYTATSWVYTESGTPATMFLEFFNASGTRVGYEFVAPAASSTWEDVSVSAVAPADAATLDVLIYGAVAAQGVSYHDDVTLTRSVASEVELHVLSEPRGHTTPTGAPEHSAAWIERNVSP
ncbi:hypothetical protein E1212_20655 [Jiangella ureilytica]|uniref:Peptidase S9 prolyl oligopeptidase catalytic domain-containing protein n=1 Tax=Jiangella ureilytica TaxID=2530374 RepID=A0A4R4RGP6_9ACTN|nr:prolyl oligopeptidase family serine peptidase [Jiangella ureilytica]TDC48608.1 hypothetical protein E1212_20655 [Jiangella ureilytica]